VPINGNASCASAKCVTTCNPNFHACTTGTVTTCADDNSPATCGTACSPCTPTDPNADPATATCINNTCGFSCKLGFNLCGGACSDTHSLDTCGPSCAKCSKPANATAVSCNGTSCVVTCDPGFEPSGTQCVALTALYVSTTGSDTNSGSQASPFRSWKRAAQIAKSGMTVNFAAGTYNANGGDDFADAIPNGVALQASGAGSVTFAADGQRSLVFSGSGSVTNLTLVNFKAPLVASSGTQTVKGTTITGSAGPVQVTGTAAMVISDGSTVSGTPIERVSPELATLVRVDAAASLTIRDTTITGSWSECLGATTSAGAGLIAAASSTVTLINMTFNGYLWEALRASDSATVALTNSSVLSNCGYGLRAEENVVVNANNTTFADIIVDGGAGLTMTGGAVKTGGFDTFLLGTGARSFRGVGFEGHVRIEDSGHSNFGTNGSRGNNTLSAGMTFTTDGVGISAFGNKWIPNVQGADANGFFPPTFMMGPVSGANVTIPSATSGVQL
jgi:hypothetical protein